MTPLRRVADVRRTLGLRRFLATLPRWALRPEFHVVVRDLGMPLPAISPLAGVRWAPLSWRDAAAITALNPALSALEQRRRWEEGQICVGGWLDAALVHSWWETTRPAYLPYLGRSFRPARGDVCVVEAFTAPGCARPGYQLGGGRLGAAPLPRPGPPPLDRIHRLVEHAVPAHRLVDD